MNEELAKNLIKMFEEANKLIKMFVDISAEITKKLDRVVDKETLQMIQEFDNPIIGKERRRETYQLVQNNEKNNKNHDERSKRPFREYSANLRDKRR